MEADYLGPYPCEAIYRYEHNSYTCRVEHGFGADVISALNQPVNITACSLSNYSDEKEVGENEAVEDLNFVLESGYNGYGCIYCITQKEVDFTLSLRKL